MQPSTWSSAFSMWHLPGVVSLWIGTWFLLRILHAVSSNTARLFLALVLDWVLLLVFFFEMRAPYTCTLVKWMIEWMNEWMNEWMHDRLLIYIVVFFVIQRSARSIWNSTPFRTLARRVYRTCPSREIPSCYLGETVAISEERKDAVALEDKGVTIIHGLCFLNSTVQTTFNFVK